LGGVGQTLPWPWWVGGRDGSVEPGRV